MSYAPPQYQVLGQDAEVYGRAMLAFVESINFTEFEDILNKHGLSQINPDHWYPQQMWLDVFNELMSGTNASSNFVSIGMKVVETAQFPPGFETLTFTEQLRAFGEAYRLNNRGKDIGHITAEVVSDHCVIMHDATPYPDDFVYGAYYALARRFLPREIHFVVEFDASVKRRDEGGQETAVRITWE